MIDNRLKTLLDKEINSEERLLWTGQPNRWRYATRRKAMSFFGLFFFGFSLFWMAGASGIFGKTTNKVSAVNPIFPLFGLPFVLVGILMIFYPLYGWLEAGQIIYAVTSQRAIIVSGLRTRKVRSIYLNTIPDLTRRQRDDGSGDLTFATSASPSDMDQMKENGFYGIANVKAVDDLMRPFISLFYKNEC